jgi:DNA primase
VTPAAKSLGLVIRKAEWLGSGKAPKITTAASDSPLSGIEAETVEQAENLPPLAANIAAQAAALPEPTTATPQPEPPKPVDAAIDEREITIPQGDRKYRIRGLAKNMSHDQLKVNVLVSRGEHVHIDSFDLYQSRPRQAFINQASSELGVQDEVIKRDLGQVLLKLEELQDRQIKNTLEPQKETPPLNDDEHREALALLQAPDLLSRILADFEAARHHQADH